MSDPVMNVLSMDPRSIAAPRLPSGPEGRSAREAALEFEGLLMAQLFQTLRKTVEPSGLFGEEGQARSTYEYLLDQAVEARRHVPTKSLEQILLDLLFRNSGRVVDAMG